MAEKTLIGVSQPIARLNRERLAYYVVRTSGGYYGLEASLGAETRVVPPFTASFETAGRCARVLLRRRVTPFALLETLDENWEQLCL